MSELSDFLGEFKRQNRLTNEFLAYYLKEQLKQQSQTPIDAPPTTWNIKCASDSAIQIIPRLDNRYKVAIANYGPSDLIYFNAHFKPLEILAHLADPNNPGTLSIGYNQAVGIGLLPAGTNVTLNSIRGYWAYNVDAAFSDATNINALISIQDSFYQSHLDPTPNDGGHVAKAWKADTVTGSMHVGSVN